MAIMRTCLCWKDLKVPSAVATTFTMAFSFIQIMLQIALWTTIDHMKEMLQILLVVLYLPLIVLDLLIIFSGIMLLIGLEKVGQKGGAGRILLMPWMSISVLYLLYEATVNIYLFYVVPQYLSALGHSIKENFGVDSLLQISFMPGVVVIGVYWATKVVIHITGLLCVISYFQRLRSEEAVLRGVANPYGGDGPYGTNWFNQPRYPFQNSTNYMPGPFKFTYNVDPNQLPGHEWTNDAGFAEQLVTGVERPGERHPVPVETQHPGYDGRLKYPYEYRSNPHFVTRRWYPYEQNWYQLPQLT